MRAIPAWAARRNRARAAADRAQEAERLGALIGLAMIDVVWSNDTLLPYHPACREAIPIVEHGTTEIAIERDDPRYRTCGHCGGLLTEAPI